MLLSQAARVVVAVGLSAYRLPALPPCHRLAGRGLISTRSRPLAADWSHIHLPPSAAREVSEERGND